MVCDILNANFSIDKASAEKRTPNTVLKTKGYILHSQLNKDLSK